MSYLPITTSLTKYHPAEISKKILKSIKHKYLEKDPKAIIDLECNLSHNGVDITGNVISSVELDVNAIAKAEMDHLSHQDIEVKRYPKPPKYKYLYFSPKLIHIHPKCIDQVSEDEFYTADYRIPLVLVTQHGIFPSKGNYEGKCTKPLETLEDLKYQTIGLTGMVYLTGKEFKGILPIYVDDELVSHLKKNPRFLNTTLWA